MARTPSHQQGHDSHLGFQTREPALQPWAWRTSRPQSLSRGGEPRCRGRGGTSRRVSLGRYRHHLTPPTQRHFLVGRGRWAENQGRGSYQPHSPLNHSVEMRMSSGVYIWSLSRCSCILLPYKALLTLEVRCSCGVGSAAGSGCSPSSPSVAVTPQAAFPCRVCSFSVTEEIKQPGG